jgi:peptidoglycan L-alanyl-D-glutamate endopeptidase CwlK
MTNHNQLTPKSLRMLDSVYPDLQKVVLRAHQILESGPHANLLSFQVTEGVRTVERQKQLVARGASRTMNSRHLAHHDDGLSRAVDLVAIEADGDVSWQWEDYFLIADAMKDAAKECEIPVRWGGGWFLINSAVDLRAAQADYIARKRSRNQKPFLDGPHFELPKEMYP